MLGRILFRAIHPRQYHVSCKCRSSFFCGRQMKLISAGCRRQCSVSRVVQMRSPYHSPSLLLLSVTILRQLFHWLNNKHKSSSKSLAAMVTTNELKNLKSTQTHTHIRGAEDMRHIERRANKRHQQKLFLLLCLSMSEMEWTWSYFNHFFFFVFFLVQTLKRSGQSW